MTRLPRSFQPRLVERAGAMKVRVFETPRRLRAVARSMLIAGNLGLAACGGEDPATPELVGTAEEYFGAETCGTANADTTFNSLAFDFSVSSTTPNSYNNPNAFKAYIWDLKNAAEFNAVNHAIVLHSTTSGAFTPAQYDTQAECQGLSLKSFVFRNGEPAFLTNVRGLWESNGCYLPRSIAAPVQAPPGTRVRVCATARRKDGSVIPMRFSAHGKGVERSLYTFDGPTMPITVDNVRRVLPVQANAVSATAYCIAHGFSRAAETTVGSCVRAVANFEASSHGWGEGVPPFGGCLDTWQRVRCD